MGAMKVEAIRTAKARPVMSLSMASRHFWAWGALALGLLLAALGSTGVGFSLKSAAVDPALLLGSFVSLVAGIALNVANQLRSKSQSRKDEVRRRRHVTRFNDELGSVLEVFKELLASGKDEASGERFFRSALREARHLVSQDGVRICVYKFDFSEVVEGDESASLSQFLTLQAFGGRGDPPRSSFTESTDHGREVIRIARGNVAFPISDPAAVGFKVDRPKEAVWKSALLVPLKKDTVALGVLMIDTRDAVEFSVEDVSVGWTLSTIIALGMGVLKQGGGDPKPEVLEAKARLANLRKTSVVV
jgi:hypothetical protein